MTLHVLTARKYWHKPPSIVDASQDILGNDDQIPHRDLEKDEVPRPTLVLKNGGLSHFTPRRERPNSSGLAPS